MLKKLKNINYFEILDDSKNKVYYGCNQVWYKGLWQRKAGCGPTTASNIVSYINQKNQGMKSENYLYNSLILMEILWKHVTPTLMGVNSIKLFMDGMDSYAKYMDLNLKIDFIDIPKNKLLRPNFSEVLNLIANSLENDLPLAFLNLCNGDEQCLDKWHWVTVISMEYEEDKSKAVIEILDEGIIKKIDLLLWFNTTTLGGGFVSVDFRDL